MNKLFTENQEIDTPKFIIKRVIKDDLLDLFNLYSNKENIKFINSDDCNGDTFYYSTIEQLTEKYLFWEYAFNKKWFIRYSIFDKENNKVIGMVELMKTIGYDTFNDSILLRLDLLLEYEKEEMIKEIISLVEFYFISKCKYKKIFTKIISRMDARKNAFISLNYKPTNRIFVGRDDNKQYKNYYIKNK